MDHPYLFHSQGKVPTALSYPPSTHQYFAYPTTVAPSSSRDQYNSRFGVADTSHETKRTKSSKSSKSSKQKKDKVKGRGNTQFTNPLRKPTRKPKSKKPKDPIEAFEAEKADIVQQIQEMEQQGAPTCRIVSGSGASGPRAQVVQATKAYLASKGYKVKVTTFKRGQKTLPCYDVIFDAAAARSRTTNKESKKNKKSHHHAAVATDAQEDSEPDSDIDFIARTVASSNRKKSKPPVEFTSEPTDSPQQSDDDDDGTGGQPGYPDLNFLAARSWYSKPKPAFFSSEFIPEE